MPLILLMSLVIFLIVVIYLVYSLGWGTPVSIHWAVERLMVRWALSDPEMLTSLGLIENRILDFHSGRLTDASPRQQWGLQQLERNGLALINRYAPAKLAGQKWVTRQVMHWYLSNQLYSHRFDYHWASSPAFMGPYPVNHVFGVQIELVNFLCNYHQIKGSRSARRYLQRLLLVDWKLTGLRESLQLRESRGVLPPRFVLEKTLVQMDTLINQPVEQNPLYTSFIARMVESGRFSKRAQKRWGQKIKSAIESEVMPAYQKLHVYLTDQLQRAEVDAGIWKLPDGQAYYNFLLRNHTTLEMDAEAIHQLGLAEVARITAQIRSKLEGLGLPSENPADQMRCMMQDPQYLYLDKGREDFIIGMYQSILDDANQVMPDVFRQGRLDSIRVKAMPTYKQDDSPIALAEPPALNGSREGTVWINLREPENIYSWGMQTLAYHEGIPGHVYQMAMAQKIRGLPSFRRFYFFSAYSEGWALYAERLASELNLTNALSELGRLQALLWRAARLVVDTGIHAYRWTREEAIDYMHATTGLPERDVVTEVERYIVMPGQACAYYIGYLKFSAWRQKAKATLGDAFEIKDFHDVLINNGGLPLSLLEQLVNDTIDHTAQLNPVGRTGELLNKDIFA